MTRTPPTARPAFWPLTAISIGWTRSLPAAASPGCWPPRQPAKALLEGPEVAIAVDPQAEKKDKRPSPAHLKIAPETRELRDRVRAAAADLGKTFDRSKPLTKDGLRQLAEGLLRQLSL